MNDYRAMIHFYLNKKKIKHSHIGYRYLVEAIFIGIESPMFLTKIMKVYERVAEIYHTDAGRVGRGIRYAVSPLKMTNKEFILKAADDLCNTYRIVKRHDAEGQSAVRQTDRDR